MMKRNGIVFIVMMFLLLSCNIDKSTQAIEEIKATDIAFSEKSKKDGMNAAFLEYIHENGVMLRPNSYPVVGKNLVSEKLLSGDDSKYSLTWVPSFADAATSGDLGYSYGEYKLTMADTTLVGTYVSVWKKVDGKWKFVLDSGNDGLSKE
jgi:ketosteroid isomerase-like protein